MDIEADPAGYQALRDARDAALRQCEGPAAEQFPEVGGPDQEPVVAAEVDSVASSETVGDADIERLRQDLSSETSAINGLLETAHEEHRWLDEAESAEVSARFESIAANPLMARVEIIARGSEIFAEIIAFNLPQADLLIEPASALFGWSQADDLSADLALSEVLGRRRDLAFAAELDQPSHEWHRAWNELRKPASEHSRRSWFVGTARVQALLAAIRGRHPTLEHHLDGWRVSLWEGQGVGGARTKALAFWLVLVVVNIWIRSCDSEPTNGHSPTAPISQVAENMRSLEEEWRALLSSWGNDTFVSLARSRNDELFNLFAVNFAAAQSSGEERAMFQGRMRDLLVRHISAAWSRAPSELLRQRAQLEREMLASLPPFECAAFLKGEAYRGQHRFETRLRTIDSEIIYRIDPSTETAPTEQRRRFSIPGELIETARSRSNLSPDEMKAALRLEGPDPQLCRGRLGIMDSILEAPDRTAVPVLREMFGG